MRARYLLDAFHISCDEGETPKTLKIPKTVKGIKKQISGGTVDADISEFSISTHDWTPLNAIVVEEGSTIFQSGTGHLRDLSGNVVCYVNYSHPTGSIDTLGLLKFKRIFASDTIERYPTLLNSIVSATYDCEIAKEHLQGEMYEHELYENFEQLLSHCENINNVSIKVDVEGRTLKIYTSKNLTLSIDAPVNFSASVEGTKGGTLSVFVLNDNCLRVGIGIDEQQWSQINCSLPWSEQYYEHMLEMGDCNISFGQSNPEGIQWTFAEGEEYDMVGVTIEYEQGSGNLIATVDCSVAKEFIIPSEYYGEMIDDVCIVDDTTDDVTISIPATVGKVRFKEVSNDNNHGANILIQYDGSYLSLKAKLRTDGYFIEVVTDFFVKVCCDDYEGYYSNVKVSISYLTTTSDITVNIEKNKDGKFTYYAELISLDLIESFDEYKMYYYTESGSSGIASGTERYVVEQTENWNYKITIPFDTFDSIRDMILTYHEEMRKFNLLVELVDESGGVTTICDTELAYCTAVRIGVCFDEDENKTYIEIINEGTEMDPDASPTAIRFEIPNNKTFKTNFSGTIYENNLNFGMNADQVIRLLLVDWQQ